MTKPPEIYLVGGAVRDRLLGLPVKDKDWLVVHATPDSLLQQGYLQVGKDFPVFLHPTTKQEYALARTERKTGKGYTGFYCDFSPEITLEQDLIRRDLTINAIAEDLDGNLHDPFNGLRDLQQKKLRHISEAFVEDPLRVLRVARFAARFHSLGFSVAEETLDLMRSMVKSGELNDLTAERVWLETEKALSYPHPEIYFYVLYQVGALTVLFDEFTPLFQQPLTPLNQHFARLNTLLADTDELMQKTSRFALLFISLYQPDIPTNTKSIQEIQLQIKHISQRYKAPSAYLELALVSVQCLPEFFHTDLLSAEEIINVFDQLDCWRKPQRLPQLCLIYRAIFSSFNLAQQQRWQYWYQLAKQVDVQQIIAAGFRQQAIKQELSQQRMLAIATSFKFTGAHHE